MKLTNIEKTHRLKINDIKYLGGRYNFIQSIQKGGTGSPQFIYKQGVEKWDNMEEKFFYKSMCSIELHPKGIALWFNKKQKIHAALMHYEEIKSFSYSSFKINAKPLLQTNYILEAGYLTMETQECTIDFYVPAPKHKNLVKFLNKHFRSSFSHDISTAEAICSDDPLYTSIFLHGVNY